MAVFSFGEGAGADLVLLVLLVEIDFLLFKVFFWIAMGYLLAIRNIRYWLKSVSR